MIEAPEITVDERAQTQTALDKLNRRNIYLALRIRGKPKLHMTLRYYANADRELQDEITLKVAEWLAEKKPEPFRCFLGARDMFGPRRNIPVLLVTRPLPDWVEELRNLVPSRDTYDTFRPHVTTKDDEPGVYLVDSVALMHRKNVLTCWNLTNRHGGGLWE